MNRFEAISSLKFKGKTKAIVVKFDYNGSPEQTAIVIGYSEVDIKSAGKVKASIYYDGSIFPEQFLNRIGESIDHYLDFADWQPVNMDAWGLGAWFIIPVAAITESHPISFWIDIAKEDFKLNISKRYTSSMEKIQKLGALLDKADVKEMTVPEWNEARLNIMDSYRRSCYTTK